MEQILLGIFILISVIHLFTAFFEIEKPRKITKLFLLPLLLIYFILTTGKLFIPVLFAAVFGWLGDFFLIDIEKPVRFKLGLASFLLGHLCYIPSFILFTGTFEIQVLIISYIIAIPLGFLIVKAIAPAKEMMIPVILYTLVILSMSIFALQLMLYNITPWSIMVFIGSLLFICSDTILAFFTFRKKPKRGDFYIMLPYISAQTFIIIGLAHL